LGRRNATADAQHDRRYGERSGELMAGDHLMLSPYWAKSSTPTALLWQYPAEKKLNKQAKGVGLSVLSTNGRTCYKHARTAVAPYPLLDSVIHTSRMSGRRSGQEQA
jgi:hypothetical protein